MKSRTPHAFAARASVALASLLWLVGCVQVAHTDLDPVPALPLVLPPGSLAADFDEPPTELVPLIEEEPREEDGEDADAGDARPRPAGIPVGDEALPSTPEPRARRWGRFGVRAGLFSTTGSSTAAKWNAGVYLGGYYRDDFWKDWFAYEVGLDLAAARGDTGDGGTVGAGIGLLRLNALFGKWREDSRQPALYALVGVGSGSERTTWELTGEVAESSASLLEFGFGLASADGSWDGRIAMTRYVGSQNATGAVTMGFGISF